MKYYDVELIDINENVENFKFSKISELDLEKLKKCFIDKEDILILNSLEGNALLYSKFFRGVMYSEFIEPIKTTIQENREDAVDMGNYKNK